MSRWFAFITLLPACTTDPEPPASLPWPVHALSVADERTLVVADVGGAVPAGSIQTLGMPIPSPIDPSTGMTLALELPPATAVAAGRRHACVLSTQQVYCWGDHTSGALGAHRACKPPATEGGAPDCILGASVMPTLPAIGAIAAGDDVTCAIAVADGHVYCWGDPALTGGALVPALDEPHAVRLPDGTPLNARVLATRNATTCAIDDVRRAWCFGDGFGDRPKQLELVDVLDLAIGARHSCAITTAGLSCWGDNRNGQVGDVAHARRCGDGPCALGATAIDLDATRVVVGERHTCALVRGGDVVCWGSNEVGQLGRSDAFLVGGFGHVPAAAGAVELRSSYAHTCALHAGGHAVCWGTHATAY